MINVRSAPIQISDQRRGKDRPILDESTDAGEVFKLVAVNMGLIIK